jgi:hypothetical protein
MKHGTPLVTIQAPVVGVFADAPASAGNVVDIANEVTVNEGTVATTWAIVANAGAGPVLLKNGSDVGDVWSIGPVGLESGTGTTTTVNGSVRCAGLVTVPAGATVNPGPTLQSQTITLGLTQIVATFPSPPPPDINHNTNTTLTLAPGAYGNVTLNMGTLSLSPGTYTFESLTLNAGTTFLGNNSSGVLFINIKGSLAFRAAMTNVTNPLNTRFAAFGTGDTVLEPGSTSTMFRGSVVCMNGALRIQGPRIYRGGYFGRIVVLGLGVAIQHQAFSAWETPTIP